MVSFFQRQERELERLDENLLSEAQDVANKLKAELTREAREMQLEQAAWNNLQIIISELKQVLAHLRLAEAGGPVGKSNLIAAEGLITNLAAKITAAEGQIKAAMTMDAAEARLAGNAKNELQNIRNKLATEAARIRGKHGW